MKSRPFQCLLLILCILSPSFVALGTTLEPQRDTFILETGDLIFLDLDCGDLCNAIEDVTLEQFRVVKPRLSHIGTILKEAGNLMVLEAWPEGGVRKTSLTEFLARVSGGKDQENGYWLGQWKPEYRSLAEESVTRIDKQMGLAYDDEFRIDNGKFYCSELIYENFRNEEGDFLFHLSPMYFGSIDSISYQVWDKYYKKLSLPVPIGEPGISPLGIYLEGKRRFFK